MGTNTATHYLAQQQLGDRSRIKKLTSTQTQWECEEQWKGESPKLPPQSPLNHWPLSSWPFPFYNAPAVFQ
jgi:hypothetical protein